MEQHSPDGRIAIIQNGAAVPRFPAKPAVSSCPRRWQDVQLERHRVRLDGEGIGTTCGYQICLNAGSPAPVTWKVNGECFTKVVGRNQLSIATDGHLRDVSWTSTMDVVLVALSARLMMDFSIQAGNGKALELIELRAFDDPQLSTLIRLLHADAASGSPAGRLYGEQLGNAVAVYLIDRFATSKPNLKQYRSALPGPVLGRVLDLIEAELERPLSLQDLADEAGISRFHFARLFRNSIGKSPARYLSERRVNRVKALLELPEKTLTQIAIEAGFSSHSHMGGVFRTLTGTTPAKYRQRVK